MIGCGYADCAGAVHTFHEFAPNTFHYFFLFGHGKRLSAHAIAVHSPREAPGGPHTHSSSAWIP